MTALAAPDALREDRLHVELLGSEQELAPIADAWRALAVASGNAFVTPDWALCWFDRHADRVRPAVVAVLGERDELVGLLPLAAARRGRARLLRFAGWELGDVFHPVVQPGQELRVAAHSGAELRARGAAIQLDQALAGAWVAALAAGCESSLTRTGHAVLPQLELPRPGSDPLAAASAGLRSQAGRRLRALQRAHRVEFRVTSRPEQLDADLETLFSLHDARWRTRGGSSVNGQRSRSALRAFAAAALAQGWLRLWTLELDGDPRAAWLGWRLGDRYSYYTAGFDPALAPASPGLVLLTHTVRAAAAEGASWYDMLLGDEAYKRRLTTSCRHVESVLVAPRGHPLRLVAAAEAGTRELAGRLSPRTQRALYRIGAPARRLLLTARTRS